MKIVLSNHAKKRMIERGITLSEIRESIEIPDYTIKKDGKIEVIKNLNNKSLKIVFVETDNFKKIVTVIKK